MNEDIIIALPSLIHRIGSETAKQAKAMALQYECELKRVRRSRNWRVTGDAIKVQTYAAQLKAHQMISHKLNKQGDGEFHYLIKKIETALLGHADKLETLEAKLIRLITQTPNITLAQLVLLTQCTEAEARVARFEAESW
ncbi:ribosome recycling factor family protein [uncultured Paraglaciecola sp.]|uniref:ribosome recycling factor family protein n=1 Tax=uncultured Paraglaciecola sp. TaxID=1765024 RepID=UPI0025F83232|nr:ribosome recycling factor family protein [uncultured Paraglaciecola sp.]